MYQPILSGSGTSFDNVIVNYLKQGVLWRIQLALGESDTTTSGTQTYTYPSPLTSHRLQNVAGVTRSYDANGNLTTNSAGTLSYDARNRLAGMNVGAKKGTQATYNYNGKGERVVKAVGTTKSLTPTTFVYSESGQVLGEYTAAGNKEYLYLDSVPVGLVTINGSTTQLYYLETDHLGTPRQAIKPGATTASDTLVWKWDYFGSAFGTNAPNPQTLTVNLRFPGQYYDSETGLNYNYFRDYEPGTGRYVESDPVGLGGGINTYAYVNGAPLELIDPLGLDSYRCRRPLGGKPGDDLLGRVFQHWYSCVVAKDGTTTCGGQTPSGSGFGSSGQPTTSSEDYYNPKACGDVVKGNGCFDKCLLNEFTKPRPYYSIVPFVGQQCQQYDTDINQKCRAQCGVK